MKEAVGEPGLVWLLTPDGKPAPVRIRIGTSDGSDTQVISGPLTEGQKVNVARKPGEPKRGFPWPDWKF